MSKNSKYRCGKHGTYDPDFERVIDGYECPRIICEKCEDESYASDHRKRPRLVSYYYNDKLAVVLQEAHNGSAIWKFDPPVIVTQWKFAKDLTPIIAEDAVTPEAIMARMEALFPEIEKAIEKNGGKSLDLRNMPFMPGEH
jgi:hypothetical protein